MIDKKRITYVILPFLTLFTWLCITYTGNQIYAEAFHIVGIDYSFIFLEFNQMVPFVSWSIYPYVISYPFWVLTFFYIGYRSKHNMYSLLMLCLITFGVCGIWYLIQQSDVQAWRESSGLFGRTDLNFTESLVMFIYNAAGPRNALPSMHCVMCWATVCAVRSDKTMPRLGKIIIWALAILIIISTQTTKQHYIIDSIVALALVETTYWILKKSKAVVGLQNFYTRINQRLRIDWNEQA
jgi:membrane-associated phospholipid phosphatase